MRVILQRTTGASVTCGDHFEPISTGLVVLLGVAEDDSSDDVDWLVKKVLGMRIFADEEGKMNLSVVDVGGELLVISQFTLHASTKKGTRPSFIRAAQPDHAESLYQRSARKQKPQVVVAWSAVCSAAT